MNQIAARSEPVRSCLACRRTAPKPDLVRLALAGTTVIVDPASRQPGRGTYICQDPRCVEAALRRDARGLVRSLRRQPGQVTVDTEDIRRQWRTAAHRRARRS